MQNAHTGRAGRDWNRGVREKEEVTVRDKEGKPERERETERDRE